VHFDYGKVDWRFVSRIMDENSQRLSRTRKGVSDTSTSADKRPLLLAGEQLRRQCRRNEEQVHRFIFGTRLSPPPRGPAEVLDLLHTIADMTNQGLLPAGRLRTWAIPAHPGSVGAAGMGAVAKDKLPPEKLADAIEGFAGLVHQRWSELTADPVPLAAWAEWELNGGALHPFYDGCGRIARSFGGLLLVRGSCLLPLYDDSASYFRHGNQGPGEFISYVRRRIEDCSGWISAWRHET
jgi:hypothetical protein